MLRRVRHFICMRLFFVCFFGLLNFIFAAENLLELSNIEGKKIQGVLVAKSDDSATVKVGNKIFKIPFTKLSKNSIELIKATEPHVISSQKFEIKVNINKKGKTYKGSEPIWNGQNDIEESWSYRTDKIEGEIIISNKHNTLNTSYVSAKVIILTKRLGEVEVGAVSHLKLKPLKPFEKYQAEISGIELTHSFKGRSFGRFNPRSGRKLGKYFGYIAAIYEGEQLVSIKSVPATYERNLELAEELLFTKIEIPEPERLKNPRIIR